MAIDPVLAGIGFGTAALGVNQLLGAYNASVSYGRQKELMDKQYAQNIALQKSSALNQVEGLRMAGLNPALAGSNPSSAQSVSLGSADMAQTFPLQSADVLALSQLANIEANTDKVKEEKRNTELHNDITEAANDALAQSYVSNIDREIADLSDQLKNADEGEKADLENRIASLNESKAKIQDSNFRGALGIAQGIKQASEASKANWDIVNNYLEGKLSSDVLKKKLNNGTANFLASMPREELRELRSKIENIKQITATAESAEKLNDEQVSKLQADIEAIGDSVMRARLSDENWLRMARTSSDPDLQQIGRTGLDNLTDTEFRKLKYDVGAGVVKGLATGGALGGASAIGNKILNGSRAPDSFDASLKEHDKNKQANPPGYFSGYGVQQFNK